MNTTEHMPWFQADKAHDENTRLREAVQAFAACNCEYALAQVREKYADLIGTTPKENHPA